MNAQEAATFLHSYAYPMNQAIHVFCRVDGQRALHSLSEGRRTLKSQPSNHTARIDLRKYQGRASNAVTLIAGFIYSNLL